MPSLTPQRRVVIAQAIGQGSVLLATPLLSRIVPVAELGTYQIALALALAVQPLATLRVDFVLPGVQDDGVARRLLRLGHAAGWLVLVVASLVAAALLLSGNVVTAEILVHAGVLAVAYSWLAIDGGRFLRTQDLSALAIRNLVSGLAASLLQCVFVIFSPTAAALTCAIVIARLLAVALSRRKASKQVRKQSSWNEENPYTLQRIVTTVSTSLLDTAILQSFVVIPGATLGPVAAGFTGMSQRITTSPASLVVGGIGQIAQARVATEIHTGEGRVFTALKPMLLRLAGVACVIGLAVAFVAPLLVVPILGPSWLPLQQLLPITAPALALQLVSLTLVPVGMVLRAERSLLTLNVVRLVLIAGGTAASAVLTQDLIFTVTWWSVSTTAGYSAQLLVITRKAIQWERHMVANSASTQNTAPNTSATGPHPAVKDQPTVLLLAKRFPPAAGGVAQYSIQVARAYARRGSRVIAVTQALTAPGWKIDDDQSEVHILNVGKGSQIIAFLKFLVATARILRQQQVQLVHATTWKMALVARVLARNTPRIVTVHGREALNVPRIVRRVFEGTLQDADLVFAVSQATKDVALAQLPPDSPDDNWRVQYNGLSLPVEAKASANRPVEVSPVEILSLCRLVPRKNVAAALRAVARIRQTANVDLHFRIAGAGPERGSLEKLAEELGISDVVDFLGFVDDADVPDLYATSDIFIHPHTHVGEGNDFEGFGITIADAMSFGCTPIVGRAGGPAELVTDGIDGWLVDGLDLDEVTAALAELVDDPALRARLGTAAKRSALERFSWDKHIQPAVALLPRSGS